MNLKSVSIYLLSLSIGLFIQHESTAQQIIRKSKETLITKIYDTALVHSSFAYSRDMKKVAYCIYDGKKQRVIVNGVKGNLYDSVCLPVFSPDGNAFIYHAMDGKRWLWVMNDNHELNTGKDEIITYVRFAPDSKNLLYVVNSENHFIMVYNNSRSKPYDAIDYNSITFAGNNQKLYYTATLNKKQFNIAGETEGAHFDQVGFPVISADGNHLAYWAINNKKSFAVVDDRISRPYDEVSSVILSGNGKHVAYHAIIEKKHVVVSDSTISDKFEFIHTLCFSPDGSKLAYGFSTSEKGEDGFMQYISLNGKSSEKYETVVEGSLKFSNDSRAFAYEAERKDAFFVVCNGREGKRYSDVLQASMVFSPDNKHIAYAAEDDSKRFVITDSTQGKPYQDIYFIAFSPNSKLVAYSAKIGGKEMVVVNGENGKVYDVIEGQGQLFFDSPTSFYYMARKANNIYLINETLE